MPPYIGAVKFVGRDAELQQVHQQLQEGDRIAISAISGMGGIGKTELAWQYAYNQRDLQTYLGGVCWLRAREDVGTQLVLFARTYLGLEPPTDLELEGQVAWCWQHWTDQFRSLPNASALIIFDDVQAYEEIKPFLPPSQPRFKVLLTTRLDLGSSVRKLALELLSEDAALELLHSIV